MRLKNIKNALIASDAIFHNSHDAIVCMTSDSKIVFVNETAVEMFGYDTAEQLLGERVERLMNDQNAAAHGQYVERHLSGENTPVMNRLRRINAKKRDGSLFPVDIHVFYCAVEGERLYTSFIRDMSEVEQKEQELHRLAFSDLLTGLPNLKSLEMLLADLLGDDKDTAYLLAVLGIDRMRSINGSFGFEVGDMVIDAMARRLEAEFRESPFLGKISGDQFVVIDQIPTGQSPETAVANLRGRLDEVVAVPVTVADARVQVDITTGVICVPDLADTPQSAIKHAEMAYGDAKLNARGRVRLMNEDRLNSMVFTSTITHQIRDAIQIGEFAIVIQPKIDIKSGRANAGEVLVRWTKSDGSMIPPDVFIPIAEDAGLINAIGRFVFLEASALVRGTRQSTDLFPKLAVNVSPRQLIDVNFVDFVEDTFDQFSIDPDLIEIEITETAVASAPKRVTAALNRLRDLGLTIALDDFGTGYSSLTMLRDMPIDKVKLDKSFVDQINEDEKSFKLVENSIRMMQDLGFLVTVEGVETRDIHDMLYALGVDEAQGYFYSKPLPVEAFQAYSFDLDPQQNDLFAKLKSEYVRSQGGDDPLN
ncbi:MAG: hypothetical protein CMM61_13070 [Rhodospirillaceae bacterium]|nr:hypothetical protein [Rhodospirillaceae bacterium]